MGLFGALGEPWEYFIVMHKMLMQNCVKLFAVWC